MAMLWFYCDESYDSKAKTAKTYVVSGFIAEKRIWERVEGLWDRVNKCRGLSRFHASHLNAHDHEFTGWTPQRSKRYTKSLLSIITAQKEKLHAHGLGMFAEEYERIISPEGRAKFGHPYLACFKHCITNIAFKMENEGFPIDWRFSVIFDRNQFEDEAERLFYALKDSPAYKYRHRLGTCTRGSWEEFTGLQVADFIAYESFRYLHTRQRKARKALEKMFGKNAFSGIVWDENELRGVKEELEAIECGPNGFIPMLFRAGTDNDSKE